MADGSFEACVNYSTMADLEYHLFTVTPGSNVLVDAGPKLKQRGPPDGIAGVTSPYWYLAISPNSVATLHIEDAGLWSVSVEHQSFGLWSRLHLRPYLGPLEPRSY